MAIHRQQTKGWASIEDWLDNLPTPLQLTGRRLVAGLLTQYSDTGLLPDVLQRDFDYPYLSLHRWLIDAWGGSSDAVHTASDESLLPGMFNTFCAIYLAESMPSERRSFGTEFIPLQHTLEEQAVSSFSAIFPPEHNFWTTHQSSWDEYRQAMQIMPRLTPQPFSSDDMTRQAARFALGKIGVAGAVMLTDQADKLAEVLNWVDRLNVIHSIHQDILEVRDALAKGTFTYPIVRTMQQAGISFENPPGSDSILGTMILTRSIARILEGCLSQLDECRTIADALGVAGWTAYCDQYARVLRELMSLFALKAPDDEAALPHHPMRNRMIVPIDFVDRAIKRAELYLLSDITFYESWDVQRLNATDFPELVAKAFCISTVLTSLCPYHSTLAPQVDQVMGLYDSGNIGYFEGLQVLPDCDSLGMLLRLLRYASDPADHGALVERALAWTAANLQPSGEMPVFLSIGTGLDIFPDAPMWNDRSAGVALNLLSGLIEYDFRGQQAIIEKIADAQYRRFIDRGLGPLGYYPPPYTLWKAMSVLHELLPLTDSSSLLATLHEAESVLLTQLEREKSYPLTPQNAAFLTLSTLGTIGQTLFERDWITRLIKSQRYDGSWADEPYFLTLHYSQQPSWQTSRLITTAFCYLALQTYATVR